MGLANEFEEGSSVARNQQGPLAQASDPYLQVTMACDAAFSSFPVGSRLLGVGEDAASYVDIRSSSSHKVVNFRSTHNEHSDIIRANHAGACRFLEGKTIPRPIYQVRAELFRTLAHPARIQVLELLRDGEHTVGELIPGVGLEPSHLSQHLGTLRRANIVQSRKKGSSVLYKVSDPRVFDLLEVAKDVIAASLSEARDILNALEHPDMAEASPASPPPSPNQ